MAIRDAIETVAKALADSPQRVSVTETEHQGTTLIEVSAAAPDVGKLIGRQGRTIQAMRTIAAIAGEKLGKRVSLEVRLSSRVERVLESRESSESKESSGWDDMVLVGRVARAHGIRGQVIVDPATDFPDERFKAGSVLHIRRGETVETVTIETVRFHRGRPIIGLAGIDTMNAAETLAGLDLRVGVDALQPLPAGSYYHHDLIGCAAETSGGERIGEVRGVEGDGASSRLIVEGANGHVLIPMVEGICVTIDVAGRKIVVAPPDGLLDVNVTKRSRF